MSPGSSDSMPKWGPYGPQLGRHLCPKSEPARHPMHPSTPPCPPCLRPACPRTGPPPSPARPRQRSSSPSSISSVPTITPSLFIRAHSATESTTPVSAPSPSTSSAIPPKPERGAKLFFTSAKTGEGVTDVFEYIARRVVMKAEYDEAVDARTLHIRHADDTIRLTSSHLNERWPQTSCCGP